MIRLIRKLTYSKDKRSYGHPMLKFDYKFSIFPIQYNLEVR